MIRGGVSYGVGTPRPRGGPVEGQPGLKACVGCGAMVPDVEGPTHHLGASPGCWAAYGEVLAREYEDYALYAPIHRLTVSAYAAQHPGKPSPKSGQSVGVHLIRLHLLLEGGLPHERANDAMVALSARPQRFPWLDPPPSLGEVTVLDVHREADPSDHMGWVRRWARSVWEAWSPHHDTVRRWAAC